MTVRNSAENAAITVASFAVERALGGVRGGIAGLVVQPVVWAVKGSGPDAADAFLYGAGAVGTFAGSLLIAIPGVVVGTVKAAVDDHTATLVEAARRDEPESVRNGIFGVDDYGFWASNNHTTCMEIASKGGVAWQHPNGVYLFMKDASDTVICDYVPTRYRRIYRPIIPLRMNGGRVAWTTTRP